MSIDPSNFHPVNVADTCAAWNVLSSKILHDAARRAGCVFCVTSFVEYELLIKPRRSIRASEQELIDRLSQAKRLGEFETHSCSIADLALIGRLEGRRRLGKGELSSIAFAMKTRQAFITDDKKAKTLAMECGHALSQTTPHLLAWLVYTDRLVNADVAQIIGQHAEMERPLEPHLRKANEMAWQYKLMSAK